MSIAIETINVPSPDKKESEDAFVINDYACTYGVFDGATPLVPFEDEEGHNGAYLAAQLFKTHIGELKKRDRLKEAVLQANEGLKGKMQQYGINTEKGEERWSTCVAVVKITEDYIHYAHLGDTMILIRNENGACKVMTTDTVKGISNRSKRKRENDRRQGLSVPEESYFNIKLNRLRYNRKMANLENGYTVANGMPEVEQVLDYDTFSKKGVKEVLLISDGLFHPELTLEETYHRILSIGLNMYIEDLTKYLRSHQLPIDDRTAVRIKL